MISSGYATATLQKPPTISGRNNPIHEVSAPGPFSFNSAPHHVSPLQRATSLSNVASSYKMNHHRSNIHHPSMVSTSRRYSPYPLHKPCKPCPSRSSIAECTPPHPSLYGIRDSPESSYAGMFFWEGILALQQEILDSPYSDDSAIATPVCDQGLRRQAFIADEQEDTLNPDRGISIDSWLTLHPPNSKLRWQIDNQPFQNVNFVLNPSSLPQLEPLPSSFSTSQSSCSFATTFPQFISPFSDSAVTSTPQSHPLYAPKPVRPIPKACFAAPEADTLPTTSLLFRPVSESVKHWSDRADSLMSGWINPWTLS